MTNYPVWVSWFSFVGEWTPINMTNVTHTVMHIQVRGPFFWWMFSYILFCMYVCTHPIWFYISLWSIWSYMHVYVFNVWHITFISLLLQPHRHPPLTGCWFSSSVGDAASIGTAVMFEPVLEPLAPKHWQRSQRWIENRGTEVGGFFDGHFLYHHNWKPGWRHLGVPNLTPTW